MADSTGPHSPPQGQPPRGATVAGDDWLKAVRASRITTTIKYTPNATIAADPTTVTTQTQNCVASDSGTKPRTPVVNDAAIRQYIENQGKDSD